MGKIDDLSQSIRWARKRWKSLPRPALDALKQLVTSYRFSIVMGDLLFLNGGWYVTHIGLLRLAQRKSCAGIRVQALPDFCDTGSSQWAFKATVFKSRNCRGFVGYGDANPLNVSPIVHGAEMRVAETRAVNRALRKAYGIGICSVEEIGSVPPLAGRRESEKEVQKLPPESANGNRNNGQGGGNTNGIRVRDRLCQVIRQHGLDAELVKAYAIDFCGTKTLREASREQVENFVAHLADSAAKDRNALLCQLNSYSRPQAGAA
jgi:hypothetical protein